MNAQSSNRSQRLDHTLSWTAVTALGLGGAVMSCAAPPYRDDEPEWRETATAPDTTSVAEPTGPHGRSVGEPFALTASRMERSPTPEIMQISDTGSPKTATISKATVSVSSDGTGIRIDKLHLATDDSTGGLSVTSSAPMTASVLESSPHHVKAMSIIPVLLRGEWTCGDRTVTLTGPDEPLPMLAHIELRDLDDQSASVTVRGSIPASLSDCEGNTLGLQVAFSVSGVFTGVQIVK